MVLRVVEELLGKEGRLRRHTDSRRRILDWLARDRSHTELPGGFEPLDRDAPELVEASRKRRGPDDAPHVIVVPDLFGTALGADGAVVWPDPVAVATVGVGLINATVDGDETEPTELLATTYGALIDRLVTAFSVVTLPYDWRRSLAIPIDELAAAIRNEDATPVHLVGHGAGRLIIRAVLTAHPDLGARVGRVLLLGTPNLGSMEMVRLVAGQGTLVDVLALLDPTAGPRGVADAIRDMASVREVMPADGPIAIRTRGSRHS